jgi:methyltransferase
MGGIGAERLLELAYSARNERRLEQAEPSRLYRPPGFRWIVGVNMALFVLPIMERSLFSRRKPRPAVACACAAALVMAQALRMSAILSLRERWNVRATVPYDLQVCTRGPYRFIRHPNYAALLAEFLALPVLGGAYASAVLLSLAHGLVIRRRIRQEERLLDAIPGYRQLMSGKPRFIPRLTIRSQKAARPIAEG